MFIVLNAVLWHAPGAITSQLTRKEIAKEEETAAECGKPGAWWLARAYLHENPPPDVAIFGSSQMGGLQAADARRLNQCIDFTQYHRSVTVEDYIRSYTRKKATAFTLALPGAMASDHFIISKTLFAPNASPKLVIVGLSPRDFIDSTLPNAGSTEAFRLFSRYIDADAYTEHAYPDPYSRLEWLIGKRLPLRRLTTLFELECANEQAPPRKKKGIEMTQTLCVLGNIKRGQCVTKPDMPDVFVDNTNEYRHRYSANRASYKHQLAFFKEFLLSMKRKDISVLVVGMPVLDSNRALLGAEFWKEFRSNIASNCREMGARWLDLSDSSEFTGRDFVDTVHMNHRGGDKLARCMARAIAGDTTLSAKLGAPPSQVPPNQVCSTSRYIH